MKFPSYELLNKYAILHFRNVIHVDYSIILTSSGWPFARDQQVMSSKIKGQDHHCTAWRRIVVVETTLFALSHFDGISRIFFFFSATIFTSQWTHYKPFGHCWRNNLLNALQMDVHYCRKLNVEQRRNEMDERRYAISTLIAVATYLVNFWGVA